MNLGESYFTSIPLMNNDADHANTVVDDDDDDRSLYLLTAYFVSNAILSALGNILFCISRTALWIR